MAFDVRYRDTATETETEVTGVSDLFLDVTGLDPSTGYEFQVRETDAGGFSAWSGWAVFSTASVQVDAAADANAGLGVTADAVADTVSFVVEYRESGGVTTALPATADLFVDVTGLTDGTAHEFRVRAVRSDGAFSGWSTWTQFATAAATVDIAADVNSGLAPSAAPAVTKSADGVAAAGGVALADTAVSKAADAGTTAAITSTGVGVVTLDAQAEAAATLTAVSAALETYNVEYRDEATQTITLVSNVTGTFLDVTGLQEGTPYEFRVQLVQGTGTSAWSEWSWFNTKADIDAQAAAQAALATVAGNIATLNAAGSGSATSQGQVVPAADRVMAGAAGSTFVALNLGIDVSSEGASFVQSTLSTAAQAHADKVSSGAGTAQLVVTGQPGQRAEVNAEGLAASVLTQTGEFVRTYSVASFQGSTLTATGAATDTIVAEGSAQSVGTGQAAPEVTRGVTGQATATVAAQGSASKGVSASSTPASALSTTGDAFIDRGFEVAGDVVLGLTTAGTPAYDAAVEGQAGSTASAVGEPAVGRGAAGASVAELFTQAVPGVDIEFAGVGSAALTAAGDAETAIVIQAGGSASAGATVTGTPAKTVSFAGEGEAILSVVGQGATNQEGQGSVAMQLRTEADTVGGTPVVPRTLSADKVSIFPAMSCYTKVTPAMTGNGAIRPR